MLLHKVVKQVSIFSSRLYVVRTAELLVRNEVKIVYRAAVKWVTRWWKTKVVYLSIAKNATTSDR